MARAIDRPLGKEMADEIMKTPGEARGAAFRPNWEYVRSEKGEEAIAVMERELARLGHPLAFTSIKESAFYPIGYDILGMIIMEEKLGFTREDFYNMGRAGARISLFLRIVMKYFVSPDLTLREAPSIWRKHYTDGRMEVVKWDQENNMLVLRLHEFNKYRKSLCWNVLGYLASIWQMVISKPVHGEEESCQLEGDPYHEFVLRW